jgi:arylsulfatase A-like enzyme
MDMATTMDLLPTFCKLSGTELPKDRVYDGYDISPILFGTGKSLRNVVFFYRGEQVYAIRKGDYKAHFITQNEYGSQTAHPIPTRHQKFLILQRFMKRHCFIILILTLLKNSTLQSNIRK